MRIVDSVERSNDETTVKTSVVPIQLAFQKLKVQATRKIEDIGAIRKSPSGLNLEKAEGKMSLDWFAFNGDNDPSTREDQVQVTGELGGSLEYSFGFDFDWSLIKIRPVPPFVDIELPEAKVGLTLMAETIARLSFNGVATREYERSEILWSQPMELITVGYLVFIPEVSLKSKIEGGASSSFLIQSSDNFKGGVDVGFSTLTGGRSDVVTPSLNHQKPEVTVKGSAYAKVTIGPKLSIRLYDAAGPYGTIGAFAKVEADRDKNPCWYAKGGIGGEVGFDITIPIFGKRVNLVDWNTDVTIASADFGSGMCDLSSSAPIAGGNTDELPKFTPWSLAYRDGWVNPAPWVSTAGGPDGNIVIAGGFSKVLAKSSPLKSGAPLWVKKYRTTSNIEYPNPYIQSVVYAKETSGYLAATTEPHGILALTNSGKVEWSKVFDGDLHISADQQFTAFMNDDRGGYYLAGTLPEGDTMRLNIWIVKMDAKGRILWQKSGGIPEGDDRITGMVMTDDGFIILGETIIKGPSWTSWLIYFDHNGNVKWSKKITGCGDTRTRLAGGIQSMDGDVLLTGALSYGSFSSKALVFKIKKSGVTGLATSNSAKDGIFNIGLQPSAIAQSTSGALFLAGNSFAERSIHEHMWVARTDSAGRMEWFKMYKGADQNAGEHEGLASMIPTFDDNGLIVITTTPLGREGSEGQTTWINKIPLKNGDISYKSSSTAAVLNFSPVIKEAECPALSDNTLLLADETRRLIPAKTTVENVDAKAIVLSP
ncbi:MAG: hypothetical protein HQK54_16720, partial [Oligoflexales bacterium]|nr:hypothetical protein [Oligoflexales bacterium]